MEEYDNKPKPEPVHLHQVHQIGSNLTLPNLTNNYHLILEHLRIEDSDVLNVYNFGSWLLGSNTPSSDRDIIIVTNSSTKPLKFKNNSRNYFHQFELHTMEINSTNYDVVIYNKCQFEDLLKCHFLVCLDCIFAPPEFIWKHTVDYKSFFMDYLCEAGIEHALREELNYSITVYERSVDKDYAQKTLAVKKLFNIARYYNTCSQILKHRAIVNFGECNALKPELIGMLADSGGDLSSVRKHVQKYLLLQTIESM